MKNHTGSFLWNYWDLTQKLPSLASSTVNRSLLYDVNCVKILLNEIELVMYRVWVYTGEKEDVFIEKYVVIFDEWMENFRRNFFLFISFKVFQKVVSVLFFLEILHKIFLFSWKTYTNFPQIFKWKLFNYPQFSFPFPSTIN